MKQQKFTAHSPGDWASQIRELAGSGEGPLLGYRLLAVASHGFQGLGGSVESLS